MPISVVDNKLIYRKEDKVLSGTVSSLSGQISNSVIRLTQNAITEINNPDNRNSTRDYIDFLERDPVAKSCMELKALRATIAIGNYIHKNEVYQKWIRTNFELMEGSLTSLVGQLCSAMALGFAVAEIVVEPGFDREWRLKGFNILDPRYITFAGSKGKIQYVYYNDGYSQTKKIPYRKCIHVVGGFTTNFNDPFGSAECKRAFPYFKAKQAILSEMCVAAKNNATGVWVGLADSNDRVQLFKADGTPMKSYDGSDVVVSATQSLHEQLKQIENSSVIVTDLKNRIEPRQLSAGEQFWNISLDFLNRQISQAFHVPSLIFNEGSSAIGLGQVSNQQKSVLDSTVEAIVLQIKENILEKVIKPLLAYQFGYVDDYGDFEPQVVHDMQTNSLTLNNIVTAASMQLISIQNPEVQNKVLDLLGLPPLTVEEIDTRKQNELLQQYQQTQMLQQSVEPQATEPSIEENNNSGSKEQIDTQYP